LFRNEDLADLKKTLADYRPFLQKFSHTTNLVSLFGMINSGFRTAKQEQNAENESMVKALPALERMWPKRPGASKDQAHPWRRV
jgi:hypothetical protein